MYVAVHKVYELIQKCVFYVFVFKKLKFQNLDSKKDLIKNVHCVDLVSKRFFIKCFCLRCIFYNFRKTKSNTLIFCAQSLCIDIKLFFVFKIFQNSKMLTQKSSCQESPFVSNKVWRFFIKRFLPFIL